jgi:hypothetical protein
MTIVSQNVEDLTSDVLDQRIPGDSLGDIGQADDELRQSVRTYLTCTTSPFIPHASRHALTPPINHVELQATCSEHLTTIELPENSAARMGERRL